MTNDQRNEKAQKTAYKKEIEQFREDVLEAELTARHNKAEFEKMHYYLEAKKIAPEFIEELNKDREQKEKQQEEMFEMMKKQIEEQNNAGSDSDIDTEVKELETLTESKNSTETV